jgi:hypothetical protein
MSIHLVELVADNLDPTLPDPLNIDYLSHLMPMQFM